MADRLFFGEFKKFAILTEPEGEMKYENENKWKMECPETNLHRYAGGAGRSADVA